jgi:RNA polymerase sigma-70 factor, ECF subfamily
MQIDDNIASKIKVGDKNAFVHIYKVYYKQLVKYAFNLVRNLDIAEEMVQDVIFKLWERRATLNIPDHIKEYLFKAVFNNCINYIKKRKNDDLHLHEYSLAYQFVKNDYHDFLVAKELEDNIKKAIESLPEKTCIAFKLNRFEGLTYAEIADKMNISVKGVEYHIINAIRKLSDDLKEYLPYILIFMFLY